SSPDWGAISSAMAAPTIPPNRNPAKKSIPRELFICFLLLLSAPYDYSQCFGYASRKAADAYDRVYDILADKGAGAAHGAGSFIRRLQNRLDAVAQQLGEIPNLQEQQHQNNLCRDRRERQKNNRKIADCFDG